MIFIIKNTSKEIKNKHNTMEDGNKQTNMEKSVSRQSLPNIFNVGTLLQSFWIRCRSVFPDITDRKFMESELRFVLYCGGILWVVYLLSKII
jgi:hypothetical protein